MVSALVPGASGPCSSPGRGHCVVFLGKNIEPLSIQEWKPNKLWGNDLRWTSIPSRGSRNTPSTCSYEPVGFKAFSFQREPNCSHYGVILIRAFFCVCACM